MEVSYYIKFLFYALVAICFAFLMAFMKKGILESKMDRESGAGLQGKTMLVLIAWLMLLAMGAIGGFFINFDAFPPRPFFAVLGSAILLVILAKNKTFNKILLPVPKEWIFYFQFFRVPLEVLLWLLFIENIIPVQMTFEGYNFDIVPALIGPILGYFIFKKKILSEKWAIAWNFIGIATVLTIVTIATLSMPTALRAFENEPSNTIIGYFPFIWLPGFLVPMAILMHIVSLKQLLRKH